MLKKLLSYGAGEGIAKGLNITTILLLPLFISIENYGVTSLLVAFEQLLMAIFLLGQNTAILRFFHKFKSFDIEFLMAIYMGYLTFGVLLLSIVVLVIIALNYIEFIHYSQLYLICSLGVFLLIFQELYLVFLRARENVAKFIFFRITYQASKFVLVLFFALIGFEEYSYLLGFFIAVVITLTMSFLNIIKTHGNRLKYFKNKQLTRKMLYFGVPLTVHSIVGILYGVIDRYMLDWYLAIESVAIYSFSYSVGSSVLFIINIFTLSFLPELYKSKNYTHTTEVFLRKYLLICFFFIATISAIIYFLISPIFIPKYYPNYIVGLPVIGIILLSVMVHPFYLYGLYKLTLIKNVKLIPVATTFALAVNVVLNIIFIPKYGIIGAGFTTLASEIFLGTLITAIAYTKVNIQEAKIKKIY